MLFDKLISVLLLVKASNALHSVDEYRIPQPLIEVLQPRGFRISIDDIPGTSYVSFHTNINQYSRHQEQESFVGNVYQATDGKWAFEERSVRLRIGDKIYYNIYVTHNKLRFGTGLKYFQVTELPNNRLKVASIQSMQPIRSLSSQSYNNHQSQTVPTTSSPQITTDSYSSTNQQLLLNCSQRLSTLEAELELLRNENEQLTNLIERNVDARKLTISGRIPPNDDAALTAIFLIRERLELNPDIISAVRKSDGSIMFEVSTLAEKLEILEAAKDKLKNSRILIS